MPFINESRPVAEKLQLDPNWVYGLIRQESRFIADVRSGAGAKGLMQVMPATGAWMAKRIDYPNYSTDRLNDPVVNLAIGQHYLATVLAELDNSPILATAAYNAGPGRSRTWRAALSRPMEGAIFAETIPFNETRGYVKNVFANAVIYAAVYASVNGSNATGGKPSRTLTQWLGTVVPKSAATTSDTP